MNYEILISLVKKKINILLSRIDRVYSFIGDWIFCWDAWMFYMIQEAFNSKLFDANSEEDYIKTIFFSERSRNNR